MGDVYPGPQACGLAAAGTVTEVEELVEPGALDPDGVHLPGIYVHRVLPLTAVAAKRIERRTVRYPGAVHAPREG